VLRRRNADHRGLRGRADAMSSSDPNAGPDQDRHEPVAAAAQSLLSEAGDTPATMLHARSEPKRLATLAARRLRQVDHTGNSHAGRLRLEASHAPQCLLVLNSIAVFAAIPMVPAAASTPDNSRVPSLEAFGRRPQCRRLLNRWPSSETLHKSRQNYGSAPGSMSVLQHARLASGHLTRAITRIKW
jgi:hypothetical protein